MSFGQTRVSAFDQHLRDAGIPIDGISNSGDAPAGITIQFQASATAEQIAWATDQRDNVFDWRRRRPVSRNAIVSALANLTTAQQNSILRHAVCYLMRQNAAEMANIAAVIGLSLPVDEVDPTEVAP